MLTVARGSRQTRAVAVLRGMARGTLHQPRDPARRPAAPQSRMSQLTPTFCSGAQTPRLISHAQRCSPTYGEPGVALLFDTKPNVSKREHCPQQQAQHPMRVTLHTTR